MASYIGQTALTALWNKLVAILSSKADRASVYSKAEVDYILATTYGTGSGSGGGGDTTDCVHLTGPETISGAKTFTGANIFSTSAQSFNSGILKIRQGTSTTYGATIYNNAQKAKSLYLPPSTNDSETLLSRSGTTAVTSGAVLRYTSTTGTVGTYTFQSSTLSSSTTAIPSSAAVKSYVDSNSGGGGGVYEYMIDGYIYGGQPWAILLNYDSITDPSSSTYKYYLFRYRRAHSKKKWAMTYLGIKYLTVDRWTEAKSRWNISTTSASTRFWAGSYIWENIFSMHQVSNHDVYNGGGYTHTFGCAICKESGGVITRVSNIAAFTATTDHNLTKRKELF